MRIVLLLLIVLASGCTGSRVDVVDCADLEIHLPAGARVRPGSDGIEGSGLHVKWITNGRQTGMTIISQLPEVVTVSPRVRIVDVGADGSVEVAVGHIMPRRTRIPAGQSAVVGGVIVRNVGEDRTDVTIDVTVTLFPAWENLKPEPVQIIREHYGGRCRLEVSVRHLDNDVGRVSIASTPPFTGADAGWPEASIRRLLSVIEVVTADKGQLVMRIAGKDVRVLPGQSYTGFISFQSGTVVIGKPAGDTAARIDITYRDGDDQ